MKITVVCLIVFVGLLSCCQVQGTGWGWWFRRRTVTYTIRNVLSEPTFEHTQEVVFYRGETFQRIMERAANKNSTFRFNAKFFNFELGYFVTAINDVFGDIADSTFWAFLRAPDELLPVGVSSYRPRRGEHLIMNFTNSPTDL